MTNLLQCVRVTTIFEANSQDCDGNQPTLKVINEDGVGMLQITLGTDPYQFPGEEHPAGCFGPERWRQDSSGNHVLGNPRADPLRGGSGGRHPFGAACRGGRGLESHG